jgi:serine/threonine protein kinase
MKEYIGKFKILKTLGEGATSTVYLGLDEFSGQQVAIKVAKSEIQSQLYTMLLNEVSLAGKLKHPHITAIYDAGLDEGQLYIVMEYAEGQELGDFARDHSELSLDTLISIFFKCCNAFGYAHEHGIIHRDIKPDNIIVREKIGNSLHVKIADFGASLSKKSLRGYLEGMVGTPSYLPPEMIMGKEADHRADIYSFGVVMFELFAGYVPYKGTSMETLFDDILECPVPRLAEIDPHIPGNISDIVFRCMQKNPHERFQNWSEIESALMDSEASELPAITDIDDADDITDFQKFLFLKNLKFFNEINDRKLWEILSICNWYHLPAGEIIVQEGEKSRALYILIDGRLRVEKEGYLLAYCDPGYVIGEVSYAQGNKAPRSASVLSETDVLIVEIEPEDLENSSDSLLAAFQEILLKILAERLVDRTDDLVKVSRS